MAHFNLESYLKDLSPELQEKARACNSVEELLKLADENSIELSVDQLDAVAGGTAFTTGDAETNYHLLHPSYCYYCKIEGYRTGDKRKSEGACASEDEYNFRYRCEKCGHEWWGPAEVVGGASGGWD